MADPEMSLLHRAASVQMAAAGAAKAVAAEVEAAEVEAAQAVAASASADAFTAAVFLDASFSQSSSSLKMLQFSRLSLFVVSSLFEHVAMKLRASPNAIGVSGQVPPTGIEDLPRT